MCSYHKSITFETFGLFDLVFPTPLPLIHHFPAFVICIVPESVTVRDGSLEVSIVDLHHQTSHSIVTNV